MTKEKPTHVKPSLYAFMFEVLKDIAFQYGYNLVLHGSMKRDLDLIAIPWQEELGDVDSMIDKFAITLGGDVLMQNRSVDNIEGDRYSLKPHGRVCYIININRDFEMELNGMVTRVKDYADPQYYLDISITPFLNND